MVGKVLKWAFRRVLGRARNSSGSDGIPPEHALRIVRRVRFGLAELASDIRSDDGRSVDVRLEVAAVRVEERVKYIDSVIEDLLRESAGSDRSGDVDSRHDGSDDSPRHWLYP